MSVEITVSGYTAYMNGSGSIICGNSGQMIEISFSSEWSAYTSKTAVFQYFSGGTFKKRSVLFQGNSVEAPILPTTNQVSVYFYAGDIMTTTPAVIPCEGQTAENGTPSTDVYNQLMEYLAGLQGCGAQVGNAVPVLHGTAYSIIGTVEETEGT